MIYYVSVNGDDRSNGGKATPFRTINHAASIAVSGDIVRVYGGVYREWVDPQNGGRSDYERIIYEAVEGEHPVIKGSEVITGWDHVEGTVWKKILPNSMFGDWNPFAIAVEGDWMTRPLDYKLHLGDVYLNGVSLFEAKSLEDLRIAEKRIQGWSSPSNRVPEYILYPERTVYQWYAEVGNHETILWCNFQEANPNRERIEINVRKCCFFPRRTGLNYITVRGFEMAHAACPFTPPTADQPGMLGPHWAKGWIIENNHLHDAKCSAISLGKEISTGHNLHFRFFRKPGYQYQMESVFLALQAGWCKEKIGSHIVRNNEIHDCGQNAVVGHMGAAFSRIEHNHIYNIAKKREFYGAEIAGIKLHAAIDTVIANNNIHHCSKGTWLDWQAQGCRVCGNLYYANDNDFMIEVTHGPCLVDHNFFLSGYTIKNVAQGTAFVHNVFNGFFYQAPVLDRATPYHFPHSTQVAGYGFVYSGDDRLINNLVIGWQEPPMEEKYIYPGAGMDSFTLPEEYLPALAKEFYKNGSDNTKYVSIKQPVWIEGNAYCGLAKPFRAEEDAIQADGMSVSVEERNGEWILTLTVPASVADANCREVTTERLGMPRLTEELYENPDGTPIDFTKDFYGTHRKDRVVPGPFATLLAGEQKLVIWKQ